MNEDGMSEWVNRAKQVEARGETPASGVKVIRKEPVKNRGALIMAIADALRPHLAKVFDGVRDSEGMLAQPAHVRAFALNMAQRMVLAKEQENAAA
mgnify:CR=1 FL=1